MDAIRAHSKLSKLQKDKEIELLKYALIIK